MDMGREKQVDLSGFYSQKKAKPTHVSAGLNRLYVSVFDYGVTAIIN